MSGLIQRSIVLAVGMSGAMVFSAQSTAAWYVGLGGGVSQLSPDTADSPFALEEEQSQAATAYLGLDINDWLSAEAAFTDLGAAGLSGEQEITYTAASLGGVAYVYGNRGMDGRQGGLSGYLRLGVNSITNESDIVLDESDSTAAWIGAGLQYPIGARFGLRAEIASYDGDAQVAMASLYWRSRDDFNTRGAFPASEPSPPVSTGSSDNSTRNDRFEQVEAFDGYHNPGSVSKESGGRLAGGAPSVDPGNRFDTRIIDPGSAGIAINSDLASSATCNPPASGEPRDAAGCALFTGVIEGVQFQDGSARLTSYSENVLKTLAQSMNNYPDLVIELQAHTEVYPQPGQALQISRQRVLAVARFLAGEGVDVQRLRARAFGSAQPRFDNNSTKTRRLNNRLALRVL